MKIVILALLPLFAANFAFADQAATEAFAPGTHGEPFTVNALVQGCTFADEGDFCFFYAEGARWAVPQGDPSNLAALEVLANAPVNAPFIITGDMIGFGDITADVVVSRLEPGQPDEWAVWRDAMQGSWVSIDDAQNVIHIHGSEQTAEYGGQVMDVSVITFANACADGKDIGPVFLTQIMGGDPADTSCFSIVNITPDRMDLSYVGRGNTLSYTRLK